MKVAVIVPAAGRSSRFGQGSMFDHPAAGKKPFVDLKGRPVWLRSVEHFVNRADVVQTLVVVSPEDLDWFREKFRPHLAFLAVAGMEALVITDERMVELGMPGVGPAFEVSCANHGGPGMGRIQQWNAADQRWVTLTDFIAPDDSVTQPLIDEDSAAFAAESGITPRDCSM